MDFKLYLTLCLIVMSIAFVDIVAVFDTTIRANLNFQAASQICNLVQGFISSNSRWLCDFLSSTFGKILCVGRTNSTLFFTKKKRGVSREYMMITFHFTTSPQHLL